MEFTAEARLPTAGPVTESGHQEDSERTLRRMKFGIAGVVPGVGVGLYIGTTLAGDLGIKTVVTLEPLTISCLKSPMTISKALRASRSASVSWKLVWASCRSVVARER